MAKKSKKKLRKKSKYTTGGTMYNNTIPATLRTTNIVAEESDPQVQQAREAQLANTTSQLIDNADALSDNIQSQQIESDRNIALQNRLDQMQEQSIDSAIGSTVKSAKTGLQTAKTLADRKLKNQVGKILAEKTLPEAGAKTIQGVGTSAGQLGFKTAAEKATEKVVTETGKKLAEEGVKEGAKAGVKTATSTAASNANLYALGANIVGTGIGMAADDNDPTTWTFGEATGDVLKDAGEYAGYGATLGSIVPGVGNLVGAGIGATIGTIKGLVSGFRRRGKARKERKATQASIGEQVKDANLATKKTLGSSLSNVAAGRVKQKTKYGYDLGINTNAMTGGLRLGIPRY